jgi:hypothetical protein
MLNQLVKIQVALQYVWTSNRHSFVENSLSSQED